MAASEISMYAIRNLRVISIPDLLSKLTYCTLRDMSLSQCINPVLSNKPIKSISQDTKQPLNFFIFFRRYIKKYG